MPRLTVRRLVITGAAATLICVPALVAAVISGVLTAGSATFLAFAGATLAGLAVLGLGIRRLDLRVRAALGGRMKITTLEQRTNELARQYADSLEQVALLIQDLRGSMGEHRVELLGELTHTRERVHGLSADVDSVLRTATDHIRADSADIRQDIEGVRAQLEELRTKVVNVHDNLARLADQVETTAKAVDGVTTRQARLNDRLYAKVEAQADIRDLIAPRAPLPVLGGWAIDADVLHVVLMELWERRPGLVVECGSGSSSVWLGYVLERLGVGRLVALEHDDRFLTTSRDLVRAHNLEQTVEIRRAHLEAWTDEGDGQTYEWYRWTAMEDLKEIGLVLVDGPPGATGMQARYPAGPLLMPKCAQDAVVLLDDTNRPDEKKVSDRWLAQWPEWERHRYVRGSVDLFRRGRGTTNNQAEP